jgi:hypothetical protein
MQLLTRTRRPADEEAMRLDPWGDGPERGAAPGATAP